MDQSSWTSEESRRFADPVLTYEVAELWGSFVAVQKLSPEDPNWNADCLRPEPLDFLPKAAFVFLLSEALLLGNLVAVASGRDLSLGPLRGLLYGVARDPVV